MAHMQVRSGVAGGGESELVSALWMAADPCLSDDDREALRMALGSAEPYLAILVLVRRLAATRYPLPHNVFTKFQIWLKNLPPLSESGCWPPMQLDLHVLAADLEVGQHPGRKRR